MKGKIKIALAGIIMMVSSTVFAQCDDSTCVGNVPLYNQPLQNTYSQQLVFNQTPATVSYNYMTSACPAGYRGANGQTGYIIDRQTVLTYSNGTVSVSDWVEYEDNCEEIPPSPPVNTLLEGLAKECGVFSMTSGYVRYTNYEGITFKDSDYLLYQEGSKKFYPMIVNVVALQTSVNGWYGDAYLPYKNEIANGRKIHKYCITLLPNEIQTAAIVKNGTLSMKGQDVITYSGQLSMNGPTVTTSAYSNSYSKN